MGKTADICNGFKNLLFENEEIEKMAEERLKFCDNCEDIKYINKKLGVYPHCSHCFCWIPTLIRSETKHCKLGKF